jgi:hypothetical protein
VSDRSWILYERARLKCRLVTNLGRRDAPVQLDQGAALVDGGADLEHCRRGRQRPRQTLPACPERRDREQGALLDALYDEREAP